MRCAERFRQALNGGGLLGSYPPARWFLRPQHRHSVIQTILQQRPANGVKTNLAHAHVWAGPCSNGRVYVHPFTFAVLKIARRERSIVAADFAFSLTGEFAVSLLSDNGRSARRPGDWMTRRVF